MIEQEAIRRNRMKERTIEELLYDLECWKGMLEHDYRREHKIAPSWLYEKIHHLEKQIKEKQNESDISG